MSLEQNKAVVLEFLDLSSKAASVTHLYTPDAQSWDPLRGSVTVQHVIQMTKGFWEIAEPPIRMSIIAVTAEEDRVAVEAKSHAELLDGRVYENTYHFLFRVRDGRIHDIREHCNTIIPVAMFGDSLT